MNEAGNGEQAKEASNKKNFPLSEKIEKLTSRILKMLCIYTIGITLLRFAGLGSL